MSAGHNDPFHHVRDSSVFELPQFVLNMLGRDEVRLPNIYGFQLTKFMVLQVVAGLLTLLVFRSLAKSIAGGKPATGIFANFWESIALFIRDNVVRPTLGGHHDEHVVDSHGEHVVHHEGSEHPPKLGHESTDHNPHPEDQHLPFVWTCFFYILFCNLLGAIPFLGSPTGNINVTGALAITAFAMTFIVGTKALGVTGFFKNLVPPLDAPEPLKTVLTIGIFFLELFGLFIKHGVLAVRLFANIMGGHTVIGVMLGFIAAILSSPYPGLWWIVTPASIAGQVGIGLLELFVAFLQAYVFAFLATIFIGMGSHPH